MEHQEQADVYAGLTGLGNCDKLGQLWQNCGQVLEALFSCFSNQCMNLLIACFISSWSNLVSMFSSLCRSGADQWVWNVLLSITNTFVYHDILGYFWPGISKVLFKIETSNQNELRLGCRIVNMHFSIFDKRYPWITWHYVTYPNLIKDISG